MKLTVMGPDSRKPRKLFGASFSLPAVLNIEVYTPKTSYVKRTSVHIKNI